MSKHEDSSWPSSSSPTPSFYYRFDTLIDTAHLGKSEWEKQDTMLLPRLLDTLVRRQELFEAPDIRWSIELPCVNILCQWYRPSCEKLHVSPWGTIPPPHARLLMSRASPPSATVSALVLRNRDRVTCRPCLPTVQQCRESYWIEMYWQKQLTNGGTGLNNVLCRFKTHRCMPF